LALKSFNRSLKSELTNIVSLDSPCVLDQFPCSSKTLLRCLRLPEHQIKRAIQL
jgi:hypothetical protein